MKHFVQALLLFVLTTFLCGCPYCSPFNLDETPLLNIDEDLVGNWITSPANLKTSSNYLDQKNVIIIFKKRTDMEYDVAITGYIHELRPYHLIHNDTINGTAYLSAIANRRFLNTFISGKVYISEIIKTNQTISILPLAEYFTSKLIKNSKELRSAVEFHYKVVLKPGYDHAFSLQNLQKIN